MSTVFIQVKNRARGNVTAPMIVWSIVMAVVIFMVEASHGAHHDDHNDHDDDHEFGRQQQRWWWPSRTTRFDRWRWRSCTRP